MRVRLLVCAAICALVAAACGTDDAATTAEPASTGTDASAADAAAADAAAADAAAADAAAADAAAADAAAADASAADAAAGDVPDLDMIDVYTGETVNLHDFVDGSTPLLLWFWAPH